MKNDDPNTMGEMLDYLRDGQAEQGKPKKKTPGPMGRLGTGTRSSRLKLRWKNQRNPGESLKAFARRDRSEDASGWLRENDKSFTGPKPDKKD